jgi:hypothetical protein
MRNKIIIFSVLTLISILLIAGSPDSKMNSVHQKQKLAASSEWTKPVNISPGLIYYSNDARIVTNATGAKAYGIWCEEGRGSKKIYFNTNESGNWKSTAQDITSHTVGEYPGPEINLDNHGNVVVVYQVRISRNYEVISKLRRNGVWKAAENVSDSPAGGSQSASILIDKNTNDYYVVWQDDKDRPAPDAVYWKGYVKYKNQGLGDWEYGGLIEDQTARAYFHTADIDSQGRVYVVWDNRNTGNKAIVWFSQNATPKVSTGWTAPVPISDFNYLTFSYPKMACDNYGNVYVVWVKQYEAGNIEIMFRKRINGSWKPIENLSNSQAVSERPSIAVNRTTGEIYVAWAEQASDGWEIYYREYNKGAWQEIQNITQNKATSDYPSLYADASGGIHLVYTDNKSGHPNIYYTTKKSGPVSVFPPVDIKVTSRLSGQSTNLSKRNTLTWAENPQNANVTIGSYRIYRKEAGQSDSTYALAGEVKGTTFTYEDQNLTYNKQYTYVLTSVLEVGMESGYSDAVTDEAIPPTYPPLNLSLESRLNSTLTRKINTLSWGVNPKNANITIANYNISRKEASQPGTSFMFLTSVAGTELSYIDPNLPLTKKYSYQIVAISSRGVPSDRSLAIVTEGGVFPPLNPTLKTEINDYLFYKEKINTVFWESNPLNSLIVVTSYKVYRNKSTENDAAFKLLSTVNGTTYSLKDRYLSPSEKYSYRVTAIDSQGNESQYSVTASE